MKFGLKDDTIKKIQTVFGAQPEIENVVLYGSRAKGNFRPGSDIDLAIEGQNIDLNVLNYIGLQLDDLDLPYTFDLAVYQHIQNPELLDHIKRVGIVFFSRRDKITA